MEEALLFLMMHDHAFDGGDVMMMMLMMMVMIVNSTESWEDSAVPSVPFLAPVSRREGSENLSWKRNRGPGAFGV